MWLLAAIVAYAALRFGPVLRLPFLFDDYTILEKVRRHSLPELWAPRELLYGWYRPWSRETHFWALSHAFGIRPLPFHVASVVLWMACMVAFASLARRVAGERAAVIAACGLGAMSAWTGTLLWAAGAQELWMMLFALLALHALLSRRGGLAALALAGALLSKETACVVPLVGFLAMWWVQRERIGAALRRVAPLLVVTAVWAVLHPTLRMRLGGQLTVSEVAVTEPAPVIALRTALSFANLERVPRPDLGGWDALLWAIPALLLLAAVLAWNASRADSATPSRGVVAWAACWAAIAAAPLLAPGIVWASYYALLTGCGVWLAVGALLAARPRIATGLVVAVAVIGPMQERTPAWEWGAPSFLARAAYFTQGLEHSLRAAHPTLAPQTRLYFADVPQGLGVGQAWFAPVFHVWYRDTTLTAGVWSDYHLRAADEPAGDDLFFQFTPPDAWTEVRLGAETPRPNDAEWLDAHRRLAVQLGLAGDWARAAGELEKVAAARPGDAELAANLAYAMQQAGDVQRARAWQARADSLAQPIPR